MGQEVNKIISQSRNRNFRNRIIPKILKTDNSSIKEIVALAETRQEVEIFYVMLLKIL